MRNLDVIPTKVGISFNYTDSRFHGNDKQQKIIFSEVANNYLFNIIKMSLNI